jgi:hypothetical protein
MSIKVKHFAQGIQIDKMEFELFMKPKWYQIRSRWFRYKLKKREKEWNKKDLDELVNSIVEPMIFGDPNNKMFELFRKVDENDK